MTAPDERSRPEGDRAALTDQAGGLVSTVAPGTDIEAECGPLRAEMLAHGMPLKDLTVLATQRDPFRVDTPAGHRDGAWLAQQIDELGLTGRTFHIRGEHYALIGRIKPDGKPYSNDTDDDYEWLSNTAVMAARWLGYVPWELVVDQRNAEPIIRMAATREAPTAEIDLGGVVVELPDEAADPTIYLTGVRPRQPYRLAIYAEKASAEPVLGPIAERFNADLFLPAGELSSTQTYLMAKAAAEDGRPLVLFTFSDCDPAGWQMPISITAKLQALKVSQFPELEFVVHRVGLLPEHVRLYGLPSTPLKPSEKRADKWERAMGTKQTELDALATLQPQVLIELAVAAISPYFDSTLSRRTAEAVWAWEAQANEQLVDLIGPQQLLAFRAEQEAKLQDLREQIAELNVGLRVDGSELDLPEFDAPLAVLPDGPSVEPLVDSSWTFPEQRRALIASKRYES